MSRKIENQMINAILCAIRPVPVTKPWKQTNTAVRYLEPKRCAIHLYGHNIAEVSDEGTHYGVQFCLCGYNTVTTRSRINAILRAFVPGHVGVCQRGGLPHYINRAGREVLISSTEWVDVETEHYTQIKG